MRPIYARFKTMKRLIFSSIICLGLSACQVSQEGKSFARTEWPDMCQDYEWRMPAESVDVETMGKKSGGGHFNSRSDNTSMWFDYEKFSSAQEAIDDLNKEAHETGKPLRTTKLKDKDDREVGEKIVIQGKKKDGYYLYWNKGATLYRIHGETEAAIAEIERLCKF